MACVLELGSAVLADAIVGAFGALPAFLCFLFLRRAVMTSNREEQGVVDWRVLGVAVDML